MSKNMKLFLTRDMVTIQAFFIVMAFCYSYGSTLSDSEINSKLIKLKPLPKVHYSAPLSILISERRLYELARITHALSMWGPLCKKEQVDKYVYICARVNKTKPAIKSSVVFVFKPWHYKFGKNLPPTDRGPSYSEEIRYFEESALRVKQWVAQSNKKYRSDVKVGIINLDSEHFREKPGNKKWNEGLREALDVIHLKAKTIFPGARIEWYGRGIWVHARGDDGWAKTPYWTGKEIKTPLSCSLYSIAEIERTRETYRRTAKLAEQLGIYEVTPYVSLGAGYRRGLKKPQYFDFVWDYGVIYAYLLGSEINIKQYWDKPKKFAPYNRATVVSFYPGPFDARTSHWSRYFIAYVRGATGIKELGDLGYQE